MKFLLALMGLLDFTSAHAAYCPDFSGQYEMVREVSETIRDLTIAQAGCDSVTLQYPPSLGTETFKLDGKRVKHAEYPEVGLTVYVTPYVRGRDILMDVERVWRDGQKDTFKRRIHLEYGPETRLLDQRGNFRSDGVFVPQSQVVYKRK